MATRLAHVVAVTSITVVIAAHEPRKAAARTVAASAAVAAMATELDAAASIIGSQCAKRADSSGHTHNGGRRGSRNSGD